MVAPSLRDEGSVNARSWKNDCRPAPRSAKVAGAHASGRQGRAEGPRPRPGLRAPCTKIHGFGSNPGALRMFTLSAAPALRTDPPSSSFSTAARRLRQATSTVRDGRRSPSATASRCLCPNSSARTIRTAASTGFSPGDTQRGHGRSAFHPSDGRQDGAGPRDRPAPRLRDRAVGRRSHGLRHARDLSRCLRRRSHHRGPAVRRRLECPGSFRKHVPGSCRVPPACGATWCDVRRRTTGRGRGYPCGTAAWTRP